jgi:hypothetical protein
MLPSNYKPEPGRCGCGCRTPVADEGLHPRFATTQCRARWRRQWAIDADPADVVLLDDEPQEPPPASAPVPVEEVAETRAEFAERIAVAPQVEEALRPAAAGMFVRPRPRARLLWELITKRRKKVR